MLSNMAAFRDLADKLQYQDKYKVYVYKYKCKEQENEQEWQEKR